MSDQDNDSPQPPAEQPREMELANDALLNGENGDQQTQRSPRSATTGTRCIGPRGASRAARSAWS